MKFSELLKESKATDLVGFKLDQAELKKVDYDTIVKLLKNSGYEVHDKGHFETEVELLAPSRSGYNFRINVLLHDERAADSFGYTDEHEWNDDEDHAMSFDISVYYSYTENCFLADYHGNGIQKLSDEQIKKIF
jgi:hypothetical protein